MKGMRHNEVKEALAKVKHSGDIKGMRFVAQIIKSEQNLNFSRDTSLPLHKAKRVLRDSRIIRNGISILMESGNSEGFRAEDKEIQENMR